MLRAADGAQAVVYLHGAHVASWITPDGREQLFMSQRAVYNNREALRGGVPVVFPQFSGFGPLIKHGFARISTWRHVETHAASDGTTTARFALRDSASTRELWDHAFQLMLAVTVGGSRLDIELEVMNSGAQPFDFTAALHTYLRVEAIDAVMVEGLEGRPYREFGEDGVQPDAPLRIQGEVDRIYWTVPGPVTVREGDRVREVAARGFPDAVVWNPGPELAARLPDMEPDGYRHMLCVEAVAIGQPVELAPDAVWQGAQTLTATG